MKVYFDETGCPSEIDIEHEIKELLGSQLTTYTITKFNNYIQPIIDYWKELESFYESYKYGELPKAQFKRKINQLQNKHFGKLELRKMYWEN